jgi:hypothetical protein
MWASVLVTKTMEQYSWKSNSHSDSQEIACLFSNQKVHDSVQKTRHQSLPWVRYIQSTSSHHISVRSILILSFHPRMGLPRGLFPSYHPNKILCRLQNNSTVSKCHVLRPVRRNKRPVLHLTIMYFLYHIRDMYKQFCIAETGQNNKGHWYKCKYQEE